MSLADITLRPIGVIHTPFKVIGNGIPIQGTFSHAEGHVIVFPEYEEGLKDLDGFSHIFLLYHFHKSKIVKLISRPYMENVERGIFAIRSPHRPNHIGLTVVQLTRVEDNVLHVKGLDIFDGTPLLDIKPYSSYFDDHNDVRIGWMKRHSEDEREQGNKTVNSKKKWLHE